MVDTECDEGEDDEEDDDYYSDYVVLLHFCGCLLGSRLGKGRRVDGRGLCMCVVWRWLWSWLVGSTRVWGGGSEVLRF